MNIIKKLVPNFSSRDGYKPEMIVVHISAGTLDSMTSWFMNPDSQVSSHYGIGKDGSILQYVEEANKAWHAGNLRSPTFKLMKAGINPNLYSIGIENEGQDLAKAPEAQLASLRELIKDIATRYKIPLDRDHIIGHYEVDSVKKAFCPSPDRTVMDKLVLSLSSKPEEMVSVPKSLLLELSKYIK